MPTKHETARFLSEVTVLIHSELRTCNIGASRCDFSTAQKSVEKLEQSDNAPVAQGIEQWFPKPCAQVRILPGALK